MKDEPRLDNVGHVSLGSHGWTRFYTVKPLYHRPGLLLANRGDFGFLFNELNKNRQKLVSSLNNLYLCPRILIIITNGYIPEDEFAIQAVYSLRDEDTRKREMEALQKLPNRLPCSKRLLLTYDEEETITDKFGVIEVMPVWKWILTTNNV